MYNQEFCYYFCFILYNSESNYSPSKETLPLIRIRKFYKLCEKNCEWGIMNLYSAIFYELF